MPADDQTPADHDAGDPAPRSDAREDQVAGDFEKRVAEEENAGAEAVGHVRESERGVHLQRCEADVDAIEVRHDVEQEEERDQAATGFGDGVAAVEVVATMGVRYYTGVRGPITTAPESRARVTVLWFAFLLAVVTYLDRVCISAAAPYISDELHLTTVQMGQVLSAFALAYSLFEIPSGWLGDVTGPRRVLTRIVLWWSAFTMLTGAAFGYSR